MNRNLSYQVDFFESGLAASDSYNPFGFQPIAYGFYRFNHILECLTVLGFRLYFIARWVIVSPFTCHSTDPLTMLSQNFSCESFDAKRSVRLGFKVCSDIGITNKDTIYIFYHEKTSIINLLRKTPLRIIINIIERSVLAVGKTAHGNCAFFILSLQCP